jgi:hypothetical protein
MPHHWYGNTVGTTAVSFALGLHTLGLAVPKRRKGCSKRVCCQQGRVVVVSEALCIWQPGLALLDSSRAVALCGSHFQLCCMLRCGCAVVGKLLGGGSPGQ